MSTGKKNIRVLAGARKIEEIVSISGSSASAQRPHNYRGNGNAWRIGIFQDEETAIDLAEMATIKVAIQVERTSTEALVAKTVAAIDFEASTITRAAFEAGTAWHIEVSFDDADLNPEITAGSGRQAFWVVVSGLTTGGNERTFAAGEFLTIEEDGSGADPGAPSGGGTATTSADVVALIAANAPTAASQAEMEAGTETALRSMSPLRVAQAIAALETGEANAAAASQAEMEAGTETALRSMSPLRVAQAIAALETGGTAGPLNNYTATAAPGASDDNATGGYSVGSRWLWVAQRRFYVCTSSATGAARWLEVAVRHWSVVMETLTASIYSATWWQGFWPEDGYLIDWLVGQSTAPASSPGYNEYDLNIGTVGTVLSGVQVGGAMTSARDQGKTYATKVSAGESVSVYLNISNGGEGLHSTILWVPGN